ncbi:MAG: Fe-Mn family superoxide dismutase [Candidatus Pacebacteria bacterium]|nr:Fe-Mn family superoxide dismutase [Candidatus Paceibacterota bacterium]
MYKEQTFNIPELKGISSKTIEEHLKLYSGYVKNTNNILEKIKEDLDDYTKAELQRRLGFEFDGMRNHEYYFSLLEGGHKEISDGKLKKAIEERWGSYDNWLSEFKSIAKTRGVGWAILYHDLKTGNLLNAWIDEQHLGHLVSCQPIIALDMWEHSFVADYQPSGKGDYVEDFFSNINFEVAENLFEKVT